MFNCLAILKEVCCVLFSYIFTLTIAVIAYSLLFNNLIFSILLATVLTALISVFIIFKHLYSEEYNGHFYAKKVNNSKMGIFLVALDTSKQPWKLVGTIAIEPKADKALLTRYCVKQEYRRLGLGSRLLNSAVKHCQEKGMQIILAECWQVFSLNDVRKCLRKAGFVEKKLLLWPSYFPVFRYWLMENILK
ncbi:hypothetical protein HOLleu_25976 [Holothuria leucospilota]|uniref:N-acetyltransferase domain-containing protein n=1 Tax=Holothuria leucospilota TaxID=206669 RepID=A0A9Q1BT86_HOLLE|nr:hypothetical protein HOLleu_25976 [Holothuria leucospilota]